MTKKKLIQGFILLQPILDLLTALQTKYTDIPISIGISIRGLAFCIIVLYLLFYDSKKVKSYILLFILFCIAFLTNMYITKGSSFIFSEIYTIVRYFYFSILLLFFYTVYRDYKEEMFNNKVLIFITFFYFGIVLIAFITGTSYSSYIDINKMGFNGWFYSSNERGSSYIILLPLLIPLVNRSKKHLPLLLLSIFACILVGTKVGLIGLVITLVSGLLFYIIRWNKNMILLMLFILVIVGINYKSLPVYNNITNQSQLLDNLIESKENMTDEEIKELSKDNKDYLIENKNKNMIYSSREVFLEQNIKYYDNQDVVNKIIGSGKTNKYLGDIEVAEKVERDFYDVFFTFGILGFVIYFIPMMYLLFNIIKKVIDNFKILFNEKVWFSLTGICLGLLVAFISGHVLLAPSVSIYFVLVFNNLYFKIEEIS